MTQGELVGGLLHALLVAYEETAKARGEEHADEWLILHDMILSLEFLDDGLEAGERDTKLLDILDEFHGQVAPAMRHAGVPADVVAGYEQKRLERFREYNPLIRKAGGSFASDAEMELGRAIASHVGEPEHPTRVYTEFRIAFTTTKESLDRIFSRHAPLERRIRGFFRQTARWLRRGNR